MAYIVNTTQTATATANNYTVTLGAHQSGDLLLCLLNQDVGGTNITANTAGWAMLGTGAASGANRSQWAWKIAVSGSETNPNFSGANNAWIGTCLVIRDAHPTAPFGATPTSGTDFVRTDYNNVGTTTSGSLTSATNEALLIYSWSTDGTTFIKGTINDTICVDRYYATTAAHIIGYRQQQTAGAAPTVTMYSTSSTEGGNGWVLAVRNNTGGRLSPDARMGYTNICHYGNFGANLDGITWGAPNAFAATINSITCSSTAPTTTTTLQHAGTTIGTATRLTSTESTAGAWVGGSHTITSTDFTGKIFTVEWSRDTVISTAFQGADGIIVGFSDGTNWATYQIAKPASGWNALQTYSAFIVCGNGNSTPYASSGTLNWAAITRIGYFVHRIGSVATSSYISFRNAALLTGASLTGGDATSPVTFPSSRLLINSWDNYGYADLQSNSQVMFKFPISLGDGTNQTYFDASGSAFGFPPTWSATSVTNWQMVWNAATLTIPFTIKGSSTDNISLSAGVFSSDVPQNFVIDSSSSTSATYNFVGAPIVGFTPTWKTGINCIGATFASCGEIDFAGATVTNTTVKKTTSTDAACKWTESGATVTNCTIDVTGTSAAYHIELGTSVTAITLTDVTFTGTPGTDKIHVLKTTGTVTITISGSTSLVAGDVTTEGATVVIAAPTYQRGLEFTGLISGSKVKVFATGTDTELFSDTNSNTTEKWDDATSGSITVDYTIQKAGYLPIRVTGITVTGATSSAGITGVPVAQVIDRAYISPSGLTLNTNCTATVATKLFTLTTASTLQNFYSYMIDQWIALGDEGEAYANVQFPMEANGPNSFTCKYGWEFDGTSDIAYLSRDGLRYLDAGGTRTASWAAILTVGVSSGMRVRYQQSDGGTTQPAAITSGNMDELVQIYGDASHGNFDYTGYMVLKVQEMGYDQAEADAVALYGTLEDQLYVVGLAPAANGIATGNPSLANPPTITDHAGSPVTWNSKDFSITIEDSAAGNTGEDIMRWLRYYFEAGGTFQSKDAFNWHDLVQTNGSNFKTVRGKVYGDTGATLKGVRVIQNGSTDSHADFDLHTADDGTTYAPPVPPAALDATVLANSRVQLYNVTTDTEIDNVENADTSYSYIITTEASVGDVLRLRVCKLGYEPVEAFGVWSSSGVTLLVTQTTDAIYTAWGIDGSTVTEFTLDVTGNIEIDANDVDGATTKVRLGAWYNYILTTENGIRYAYGAITPVAVNAIRVNVDTVDLTIENVNASTALRFTDTDVRLYRSNGTSIISTSSYSIHNDYSGVPDVVTVTGSNVITGDISDIPSVIGTVSADLVSVNGISVTGSGTELDPWGP